ncbi:hypothetical protein SAMD00019534_060950 [Acytostelium subglobosum LB1]|uniref:hypothetical protein n=1 Tax=Acytostelium subglobosum LB1 TaxID=1410327 RepID=UPI00064508B6|nr:hypothetical protein SAMD00019534_060950 [Acytostelium subglobosum LB1]GAM22920.1 hypothetical protein SAMD00019534_060950 [Acytostelium subglobosum LB1]|eukprot:XP_012754147.1 hypothetical protein SAMD00019534_060950 [Acytostelium subglobosum LB1]
MTLSSSRTAGHGYASTSSNSGNSNNNNNKNDSKSDKNTASTTTSAADDQQQGSTEKIKKLLQTFDQKFQNNALESDQRRASGGPQQDRHEETYIDEDGDEIDEDGLVKSKMTEEEESMNEDLETMIEEEMENGDEPYAFDPKMMRQFNRYQQVAIPADNVEFHRNMEMVNLFVGEDEDAEAIDKELAGQDFDELIAEEHEELFEEDPEQDEMDLEIEDEERRYNEAIKNGEPIEAKSFSTFAALNYELPEDATPEQIQTHITTIKYLKQYGIDTTKFTTNELAFMARLSPEELQETVDEQFDTVELAELEEPNYEPALHEVDEETGIVKEEISDAYVLHQRDKFEFDLDEDQKKAIEEGQNKRKEASAQDGHNTLYDDHNASENFFLVEDERVYNEEEFKALSDALDSEPLYAYEKDNYLDSMQELDEEDLELNTDGKQSELRTLLDPLKHLTPGLMSRMTEDQNDRFVASLKLDKYDNMPVEEFKAKVEEMKAVDPKFAESLVDRSEEVPLVGTEEEIEQLLSDELMDENGEDEDDIHDETDLFEFDDRTQETIVDGAEGLVQFQDYVDNLYYHEQLYDTEWHEHLRVLGTDVDMYLRRNKKKMVALSKRRERAAKYRAETLKKNAANPVTPVYKRQELPSGEYVFKSTHAPNTFVRIKPFTEEEIAPEHADKFKQTLTESYRTLSGNGYYSRRDTKKTMEMIRRALASYKPHMNSRRLQLESSDITKDPRFEKQKNLIVEPWMLPRYNPEYYSGEDMQDTGSTQL